MLDKATISKTRPTTAKLRVKVDLAKPILREITVEIGDKDGNMDVFLQIFTKGRI